MSSLPRTSRLQKVSTAQTSVKAGGSDAHSTGHVSWSASLDKAAKPAHHKKPHTGSAAARAGQPQAHNGNVGAKQTAAQGTAARGRSAGSAVAPTRSGPAHTRDTTSLPASSNSAKAQTAVAARLPSSGVTTGNTARGQAKASAAGVLLKGPASATDKAAGAGGQSHLAKAANVQLVTTPQQGATHHLSAERLNRAPDVSAARATADDNQNAQAKAIALSKPSSSVDARANASKGHVDKSLGPGIKRIVQEAGSNSTQGLKSAQFPQADGAQLGASQAQPTVTSAPATPPGAGQSPVSGQSGLNPGSLQSMQAQIHTLHQAGGGQARIQLNPPSLGQVQIHLQLQANNEAQLSFTAAQPGTAQALQSSLPQLNHALQQSGIHVTHSEVNAGGPDSGAAGQQGHAQRQGQHSQGEAWREQPNARASHAEAQRADEPPLAREHGVRAYA